jgi:flagellar biosynthesis protein FliR
MDLAALTAPYRVTFLLVFFRLGGMATVAPLLGHRAIPMAHRAGLAALLALILTPVVGASAGARLHDGVSLVLAIAGELAIGIMIGFVASLVVAAVHSAAELVAFQMGLGFAGIYDPAMGQQANVLSRFEEMLVLLLLLAVNAHHAFVHAVAASFQRIAPGAGLLSAAPAPAVVALGSKLFRSGLELAAPLVGVLFVVNVVMAFLTRVAPQTNAFVLGVPVAIVLGMLGLVETFPHFFAVVSRLVAGLGTDLGTVLPGVPRG